MPITFQLLYMEHTPDSQHSQFMIRTSDFNWGINEIGSCRGMEFQGCCWDLGFSWNVFLVFKACSTRLLFGLRFTIEYYLLVPFTTVFSMDVWYNTISLQTIWDDIWDVKRGTFVFAFGCYFINAHFEGNHEGTLSERIYHNRDQAFTLIT